MSNLHQLDYKTKKLSCDICMTLNITYHIKLKDLSNMYYVQYFVGMLPVNYALHLRNLSFLQKQSVHHMSTFSNESVAFIDC